MSWPQAILLDFYGTVVAEDSAVVAGLCTEIAAASSSAVTTRQVAAYWSQRFTAICAESHGEHFRRGSEVEWLAVREVLDHFDAALDADELCRLLFSVWRQPALLPGAREVLSRIDVPVCLVSNSDNADLAAAREYHALVFPAVVTSEDCRAYKPREEPFRRALALLGRLPQDVLHVGNSLRNDVFGAQALGIPTLWLNPSRRALPAGAVMPDFCACDLAGVLTLLGIPALSG